MECIVRDDAHNRTDKVCAYLDGILEVVGKIEKVFVAAIFRLRDADIKSTATKIAIVGQPREEERKVA